MQCTSRNNTAPTIEDGGNITKITAHHLSQTTTSTVYGILCPSQRNFSCSSEKGHRKRGRAAYGNNLNVVEHLSNSFCKNKKKLITNCKKTPRKLPIIHELTKTVSSAANRDAGINRDFTKKIS